MLLALLVCQLLLRSSRNKAAKAPVKVMAVGKGIQVQEAVGRKGQIVGAKEKGPLKENPITGENRTISRRREKHYDTGFSAGGSTWSFPNEGTSAIKQV